MTPAQAYGHPNFITDVPVQGPTDPGMRAADVYYAQNFLPKRPGCADCSGGLVPMWARTNGLLGVGEQVSFGGRHVFGSLAGPNDDVWGTLNPSQQAWVADTLRKLNDVIVKTTGTTCPSWNAASITATTTCFKQWFNANYAGKLTDANGQPIALAPTTVFDKQTLDALITIAGISNLTTPYPGDTSGGDKKKLSTAAMVGIGAGALGVGGLIWAATRKKSRR